VSDFGDAVIFKRCSRATLQARQFPWERDILLAHGTGQGLSPHGSRSVVARDSHAHGKRGHADSGAIAAARSNSTSTSVFMILKILMDQQVYPLQTF
jgi:hypothetical protein